MICRCIYLPNALHDLTPLLIGFSSHLYEVLAFLFIYTENNNRGKVRFIL